MNDGIYVELFAVKDGVRYNAKIIDMKDLTMTLTTSLVDGIEKLWEETKPAEEPEPECQHVWRHEHTIYNYEKMCAIKLYRCVRCGETITKEVFRDDYI